MKVVALSAALLLLSSGSAYARSLHIHVDEKGGDRVRITMPFSVARAGLSITGNGKIEIDDEDVDAEDLRTAWDEIKKTGEKEIVRVESDDDDDIRITREKGVVRVTVREKDGEKVDVRMPESAVDALLSGKGNELDLGAAMKAIQEDFKGDLVTVEDGEDTVRIWVD